VRNLCNIVKHGDLVDNVLWNIFCKNHILNEIRSEFDVVLSQKLFHGLLSDGSGSDELGENKTTLGDFVKICHFDTGFGEGFKVDVFFEFNENGSAVSFEGKLSDDLVRNL